MNVRQYYRAKNLSGGLEPETLATIDRMSQPPSPSDTELYNEFIKKVKIGQGLSLGQNNLNTLFDGLWIRCSHDAQAALLNWSKNAHDSIAVNSPIFTAYEGYRTSPANSYIDLNFSADEGVAYGDGSLYHVSAWNLEKVGTANSFLMSARDTINGFETLLFRTQLKVNSAGTAVNISTVSYLNDFYGERGPSALRDDRFPFIFWVNGSIVGTSSSTAGLDISTNINLYENARNDNGALTLRQNGLVGLSSVGKVLPDPLEFYLAKQWLLQQLNLI